MRAHQNPFRSSRIEALPFEAPGVSVASLLAQLERQGGRGSLVGPKGSGKTTLLLELSEALASRGLAPRLVRLRAEAGRPDWGALRRLPARTALLVDGAEQLSRVAWWRVHWQARRVPVLITTSHARAHLPLLYRHVPTPALLRALVARLLAAEPAAATTPPPAPASLDALFARHGGDLRACFRELYERYGDAHLP